MTEHYSRAVMAKRFEETLVGVVEVYGGGEPASEASQ